MNIITTPRSSIRSSIIGYFLPIISSRPARLVSWLTATKPPTYRGLITLIRGQLMHYHLMLMARYDDSMRHLI